MNKSRDRVAQSFCLDFFSTLPPHTAEGLLHEPSARCCEAYSRCAFVVGGAGYTLFQQTVASDVAAAGKTFLASISVTAVLNSKTCALRLDVSERRVQ